MKKEEMNNECCKDKLFSKGCDCRHHHGANSTPIYCLGVIGALFYFLQGASSFSLVMVGIAKAIFWPAILMFKLLTYLKI